MYTVNTSNWSRDGLVFRRRIQGNDKQLELPRKVIQIGKTNDRDTVSDDVRGANEFYKQVDSGSLNEARESKYPFHLRKLDEQIRFSNPDEFNFVFLDYTDAHQILNEEAEQIIGILDKSSDYIITPIQSGLVSSIKSGIEDSAYQALRTGTELILQQTVENGVTKPVMGGLPLLNLDQAEDLIQLYEKYGVEAFYIDFDWQLPRRPDKAALVQFLQRRFASQRIHEDVILYGINMRLGTKNTGTNYLSADDLASVLMGIDFIGGNHSGPNIKGEVADDLSQRGGFRLLDRNKWAYEIHGLENIHSVWPDESELDVDTVLDNSRTSNKQRDRYETLVNAEQMELELSSLRTALEENRTKEFLSNRNIADESIGAGRRVRNEFDKALQSDLAEFS